MRGGCQPGSNGGWQQQQQQHIYASSYGGGLGVELGGYLSTAAAGAPQGQQQQGAPGQAPYTMMMM